MSAITCFRHKKTSPAFEFYKEGDVCLKKNLTS